MSGSSATSPSPTPSVEEPSEALLRLRQGKLTPDGYLDSLVEAGIEHLKGRVGEERLEIVREVLRDSLRESPEFQETLRVLTGDTIEAAP